MSEWPNYFLSGSEPDPSWREQAACREADKDLFFPVRGETFDDALKFCNRCPVRVECGEYASRYPWVTGVWGGMSNLQRTTMRRTWLRQVGRRRGR